jgi:hypothetical protein
MNSLTGPALGAGRSRLVAHFRDGQISKGFSRDFDPTRDHFHMVRSSGGITESREIRLDELKALFHVKTGGRKDQHLNETPIGFNDPPPRAWQRGAIKTVLEFYDGEKIFGYSRDYDPNRRGFYVVPADRQDNNRTIYVVNSALINIQFLRE